jgi:CHAT domain
MYRVHEFEFLHALAGTPPVLPIDILYYLPEYITNNASPEWIFNLPGAINDLMGSSGWERGTQVLKPRIFAPGLTDAQLIAFASAPFGRNKYQFPRIDAGELRAPFAECEIVHFVGSIFEENSDTFFNLLNPSTRLLILQNLSSDMPAPPAEYLRANERLAQVIIEAGGPPVLIMAGARRPEASNRYLADVYAKIVHDQPLSEVARPDEQIDEDVIVELLLGQGGDDILRLSVLRAQLDARVRAAREAMDAILSSNQMAYFHNMSRYLDQNTVAAYGSRLEDITSHMERQVSDVGRSMEVAETELNFAHESAGAIPLAESNAAMAALDDEISRLNETARALDDLTSDLTAEAHTAPRVLNAGFADATQGNVLGPREVLISGREYDFLIDIGPKWNNVPSLVVGNQVFPEFALPPDESGYPVHVVFISSELEQQFFSAWIYVPRHTGRSFPYNPAEEKKAEKSGPIAFRFKAPPLKEEKRAEIHGRLCLYYRNNLIQSARVQASVADTAEFTPEVDNVVDVDYVISGKIQNLDEYATRKLRFTPQETLEDHPISVNVTLNDDGKHHRVLVRQRDDSPTAPPTGNTPVGWTPFDPLAARWALENARQNLKSCFFLRDEDNGKVIVDSSGEPTTIALSESPDRDKNNAKTRIQFLWDLIVLAKFGRNLYDHVFTDVRPEGSWPTKGAWTKSLRETLETSSIIQVARTGAANYVFPWALIYQYPLDGAEEDIQLCKITEEWDNSGRRTANLEKCCKYRNEDWHERNIICPYGFWGLNHIIEQPMPALQKLPDGTYVLRDAESKIRMGPSSLDLSVGVTHDLSPNDVRNHLKRLGAINPLRLHPPDPADDRNKVRAMLNEAMVVYFLCHGEYDTEKALPYLSIGLRDQQEVHRIYPNILQQWADGEDLKAWGTQRPLVFINGCHTTDLKPGEVLNFVTALNFAGAGGVIGTEISVLANVAIEVAESIFEKIAGNMPVSVGEAMYQTRWELANKGNLLGLAYSLFCLANLHVTKN